MGYNLHIIRKEHWFDEEGPIITEDDWKTYVESDDELTITGDVAEAITPTVEVTRMHSPMLTKWENPSNGESYWFHYSGGNIEVKYVDDDQINKMKKIAIKLNAKVEGDEGEIYGFGILEYLWRRFSRSP